MNSKRRGKIRTSKQKEQKVVRRGMDFWKCSDCSISLCKSLSHTVLVQRSRNCNHCQQRQKACTESCTTPSPAHSSPFIHIISGPKPKQQQCRLSANRLNHSPQSHMKTSIYRPTGCALIFVCSSA